MIEKIDISFEDLYFILFKCNRIDKLMQKIFLKSNKFKQYHDKIKLRSIFKQRCDIVKKLCTTIQKKMKIDGYCIYNCCCCSTNRSKQKFMFDIISQNPHVKIPQYISNIRETNLIDKYFSQHKITKEMFTEEYEIEYNVVQ